MENVNKNPLEYFQSLLEKDKSNELKTTYISEIIEHYGSMIEKVDNENGIVTDQEQKLGIKQKDWII
ncbi:MULTISPECIES: hypothetical protein [Flavobacterium]|uniref:Uncharacterized protein n=2 Tax=Flavobacterium TaxID=237 RepID=A0ABW8PKL4_9FLAO|nr:MULTISPECIES: hypothetical protein [Flavobacterium]QYS88039.1 hypothetical protein JJC05_09170 [Flavobacterium davisii]SPE77578.1 hypothetical protein FLACOL_01574 [Flavobacterium columnare]